jgi:glycosyltransferase involved in cell wall biosynthesis
MAAGKVVLVSDQVGCAADLVKDKLNGAIFKSGNEQDLTDKLVSLCADKHLLKSYGRSAAELIKNWSFEKQVALMATELEKNATSE